MVRIIFGDVISSKGSFHINKEFINADIYSFEVFGRNLFYIVKFIYLWVLAPFFWVVGFFHFKEYEV